MLQVKIIVVGKLKEKYLTEGCAEYVKRLAAYCKPAVIEIPETKLPEQPNAAQIRQALDSEAKLILDKAKGGEIIALCIEGAMLSSEQLSEQIEKFTNSGVSTLSFVIGSSHGLSDIIKNEAALSLSISKMTFPHQLARLVLLEQIYRALSISAGSKYHK